MHIALVIDEQRLIQEQAMLNRLCIGLAAEGSMVTRIVPDAMQSEMVLAGEARMALLPRIVTSFDSLPWTRRRHIDRLAASLADHAPDVFYALGSGTWRLAMDVAETLHRPLAIELWSHEHIRRPPRSRHAALVHGYTVPNQTMAGQLRRRAGHRPFHIVPFGVPAPRAVVERSRPPSRQFTIAIIGAARDVSAYNAMFAGLAEASRHLGALQVFVELRGPREHEIWQRSQASEMSGAVSAMSAAMPYRALLTQCDLMCLPERYGELRSVVLEAMANGVPIISSQSNMIEPLVADETAIGVRATSPEEWAKQLLRVFQAADERAAVASRARNSILSEHQSSRQISAVLAAMENFVSQTE